MLQSIGLQKVGHFTSPGGRGLHQTVMQDLPLEEIGEEGGLGRKINVSLQYMSMRVSVIPMENPEDKVAHWKALVFLP